MKNPFDNLPGSDDEDNSKFVNVANKNKQDAGQKKTVQQPRPQGEKRDTRPNVNDNLVVNQRQNTQSFKRDRDQRPVKEITDHRAHDKQSGMGRVSEPRKGAGGRGGIGNLKDELNQDKILARVNENEEEERPKTPSPQKLTLEEYYANQGLDINALDKKKAVVNKGDAPKADWVAKEKLEFVKSKQDNVLDGEAKKVAVVKNQQHKIELAPEQNLLGFVNKVAPQKRPERPERTEEPKEPRQNRREEKGDDKNRGNKNNQGGRKYEEKKQAPHPKLVVTEEDFPSL